MVPELIVGRAAELQIDLLGITDHNSGENAAAMLEAAEGTAVAVLPGMEVECREGVHLLTLFDRVEQLDRWQGFVYDALPPRENVERVFGAQLVVDAAGNLLRKNPRLLITAVDLSLEEVIALSQAMGGFCLPAHVDRPANGLLPVLGLLPTGLGTPALETSPVRTRAEVVQQYPELAGRPLIRSSDAHRLADIGRATTTFLMARPSVAEVGLACRRQEGRKLLR